jgi:hypothetical protein
VKNIQTLSYRERCDDINRNFSKMDIDLKKHPLVLA